MTADLELTTEPSDEYNPFSLESLLAQMVLSRDTYGKEPVASYQGS